MDENGYKEGISLIIYLGMAGMFFLALAIIGFVIIYNRRLLQQQLKLQSQKIVHQQQLLNRTIKIQDRERKRFAADLHDEIGGGIATILLHLAKLKEHSQETSTQLEANNITTQLNSLLNLTRKISYNIMPPTLEDFGLMEALNDLCYNINQSGQLSIKYNWRGSEERLPFSAELAIYRISKELLVNTVKHSEASIVEVAIDNQINHFELQIKDNGKGFHLDQKTRSAGLKNLYDRALIINAQFNLESSIGNGTSALLVLQKKSPNP